MIHTEGMLSSPLEASLADATLRLLGALAFPTDAHILAPFIVREICYRVLTGEQGVAFEQLSPIMDNSAKSLRPSTVFMPTMPIRWKSQV